MTSEFGNEDTLPTNEYHNKGHYFLFKKLYLYMILNMIICDLTKSSFLRSYKKTHKIHASGPEYTLKLIENDLSNQRF